MRKIVEKSMLGKAWVTDIATDNQSDLVEQILTSRGIKSRADIEMFLNPRLKECMPDPFVLQDMEKAAAIIVEHIIQNKKIAIYGDYDVDGITSAAIMVKYLNEIGADVIWHLPTREGEGYGLNTDAIDNLAAQGTNLIITVDCGISGLNEIAHANNLGLTVVVTDHHSPDSKLPDAAAIVNPKRVDDTSGLSYLAGVGVAFLTLVAVNRELKKSVESEEWRVESGEWRLSKSEPSPENLDGRSSAAHLHSPLSTLHSLLSTLHSINLLNYMDLVALGTICDTMPLIKLNRAFAATGLKVLGLRQNLGLRVLMDVAGIKKPTTYSVMFALGPRLNAAGRLDSAAPVLELLLTDNVLIANDLANRLHHMNQERIDVQNAIMLDAARMAQKCVDSGNCSLFICGDNWRSGVMGIIAGRLKDKYNLPSCVATKSDGMIDGSGRSIPGVDLGKIIHNALALGIVSGGGGHAAAAGFSLSAENEKAFCEFLEKSVLEQLDGKIPENEIFVDAELDAGGATMDLVNRLSDLEPFGQENPEPTLVLHGGTLAMATTMGKSNVHLRGTVNTSNGTRLAFVGFNMTGTAIGNFLLDDANINTKITLLGKLKENEYNGRVSAQFILEDLSL